MFFNYMNNEKFLNGQSIFLFCLECMSNYS